MPSLSSPSSLSNQRRIANALAQQGMDASPISSPWQALGRVANAAAGAYGNYQADQKEEAGRMSAKEAMAKLLQAGSNPSNADIMGAMNNEWLSDGQGRIASALMEENIRRSRPADPTDDESEYMRASKDPAFRQYLIDMKKAGSTNINMPGQPNIGSIPQGWAATQDPETKAWSMAPIPGGPAAVEAETAKTADKNRKTAQHQRGGIVTQDIDRSLNVMKNQGMIPGTGWGAMLSGIPGTDAKSLSTLLDTVKANIGFEELQKMRMQSPTGGALGNVTERELAYLQSVAGSLDQSQDEQQLTDNLNRLWNAYQDVVHGPGQGPERRPLMFEQEQQQQGQDGDGWTTNPQTGNRIRQVQ